MTRIFPVIAPTVASHGLLFQLHNKDDCYR